MLSAWPIEKHEPKTLSRKFAEIPRPPRELYARGTPPSDTRPHLAIVGSRKYSAYGREMCEHLVRGLAGTPIVIVSGLALGIDGIAHRSALEAGLTTIAILGSGLDERAIYPRSHARLAGDILSQGGALISEYEPKTRAQAFMFPERNRIMAGLSDAVLVIEAAERSGSLITARLALEYNRDVLAVPGPVFNKNSKGVHDLIKDGATPITSSKDILDALGLEMRTEDARSIGNLSPDEEKLFSALSEEVDKDDLLRELSWPPWKLNTVISSLAIKQLIKDENGKVKRM